MKRNTLPLLLWTVILLLPAAQVVQAISPPASSNSESNASQSWPPGFPGPVSEASLATSSSSISPHLIGEAVREPTLNKGKSSIDYDIGAAAAFKRKWTGIRSHFARNTANPDDNDKEDDEGGKGREREKGQGLEEGQKGVMDSYDQFTRTWARNVKQRLKNKLEVIRSEPLGSSDRLTETLTRAGKPLTVRWKSIDVRNIELLESEKIPGLDKIRNLIRLTALANPRFDGQARPDEVFRVVTAAEEEENERKRLEQQSVRGGEVDHLSQEEQIRLADAIFRERYAMAAPYGQPNPLGLDVTLVARLGQVGMNHLEDLHRRVSVLSIKEKRCDMLRNRPSHSSSSSARLHGRDTVATAQAAAEAAAIRWSRKAASMDSQPGRELSYLRKRVIQKLRLQATPQSDMGRPRLWTKADAADLRKLIQSGSTRVFKYLEEVQRANPDFDVKGVDPLEEREKRKRNKIEAIFRELRENNRLTAASIHRHIDGAKKRTKQAEKDKRNDDARGGRVSKSKRLRESGKDERGGEGESGKERAREKVRGMDRGKSIAVPESSSSSSATESDRGSRTSESSKKGEESRSSSSPESFSWLEASSPPRPSQQRGKKKSVSIPLLSSRSLARQMRISKAMLGKQRQQKPSLSEDDAERRWSPLNQPNAPPGHRFPSRHPHHHHQSSTSSAQPLSPPSPLSPFSHSFAQEDYSPSLPPIYPFTSYSAGAGSSQPTAATLSPPRYHHQPLVQQQQQYSQRLEEASHPSTKTTNLPLPEPPATPAAPQPTINDDGVPLSPWTETVTPEWVRYLLNQY